VKRIRRRAPATETVPASQRAEPAILIVDDDLELISFLAEALGKAGLRTVEAADAEAALALLAVEQIGCVVADLRMPGMNGIDLVRTLRSRPETATLPFILMTGYVDGDGAIEALDAGADDFMPKAVQLDELVARVRAHLRTQTAWSDIITDLHSRADAITAIGQLAISKVPEHAAEAVVSELARRAGTAFVAVFRMAGEDRLQPLATWNATDGLLLGGLPPSPARCRYLVTRAREGPWAERIVGPEPGEPISRFWTARPDFTAVAPIHAGDDLVGLLVIGMVVDAQTAPVSLVQARLLSSAIDYASVLGVVAGPMIADRQQSANEKADLRQVLAGRRFFPVYQPIVSLRTGSVVGHEALTRFVDGTPPDVRFSRAAAVGLGFEFELAAIEAAIGSAPSLPLEGFLSLNVSPGLVVAAGKRLRRLLDRSPRRIVLEVTEHTPIADYAAFGQAVRRLGNVELSIDDAGAGYASLRHILELGPAWVKLDITLVQGIDGDPLRQSLVAGLAHFATRSGERLVAEGVERQEEADTLLGIGVEFAQGYLFGRPEPSGA
jgi:EAL domain-containing protein (putative c-di-GMP-specific phosphodiesterase class I)/CheY-like chemotaxis protein